MSSSAFFIEAAANTVRLLSCARAGDEARSAAGSTKAAKIRQDDASWRSMRVRGALLARATQALVVMECDRRKRRSGNPSGFTIRPDIAAASLQHCRRLSKGSPLPAHCFASGASSTCLQAAGSCASVIGGRGFGGVFRRLGVDHGIVEPEGEIAGAAALGSAGGSGWLRIRRCRPGIGCGCGSDSRGRTSAAPCESQQRSPSGVAAQRLLDRGVDEDALDARLLRGGLDHARHGPASRLAGSTSSRSGRTIIGRRHLLALVARQSRFGIGVSQMSASSPT